MTDDLRPNFSFIIKDNEQAAARSMSDGNYVQSFLLLHALIESLLRAFLQKHGRLHFTDLITEYKSYLESEHYQFPTFVTELEEFNRRRNRIVHELWRKGFTYTNRQTEPAAQAAINVYGLLIEWLETFDPAIMEVGFAYE